MRSLKTLIYKLTGGKNYLLIVSSFFFLLYRSGFLKIFNKFDTHYIAPALVRKGWVVIDIGANLGYYSVILAEATGKTGKLYAVEPIGDYRVVLTHNIKKLPWVEVIPYALGDKNGTVRMIIPGRDKTRHGLTRVTGTVLKKESLTVGTTAAGQGSSKDAGISRREAGLNSSATADQNNSSATADQNNSSATADQNNSSKNTVADDSASGCWDAEIRRPAELFGDIETVHYIKCDIEGYEAKLFPELMPLIRKSKPIIQVEISKQNRSLIKEMIIAEGYSSFTAERGGLVPENAGEIKESDTIFIPDDKIGDYSELLVN